jgi:hypothetical protein
MLLEHVVTDEVLGVVLRNVAGVAAEPIRFSGMLESAQNG